MSRQPVFCTACGDQLDDFCFTPEARDLDILRAHAFRCHLEGRTRGGICAKLYIADDAHPAQAWPGDGSASRSGETAGPSPQTPDEQVLRDGILSKIARDADPAPGEPASDTAPSS